MNNHHTGILPVVSIVMQLNIYERCGELLLGRAVPLVNQIDIYRTQSIKESLEDYNMYTSPTNRKVYNNEMGAVPNNTNHFLTTRKGTINFLFDFIPQIRIRKVMSGNLAGHFLICNN